MQSNKGLLLVFGVLVMVIAASLSQKVVDQENDAISDRRFRWEFSQDSDESANDLQEDDDDEDDSELDDDDDEEDDEDDIGSDESDDLNTVEIITYTEPASSESASNEA
ncbi:nucleosome assembly protein 1;1 [Drosophila eugracilis]|uniref:nucleosome assembly protein 1;1 n=1 Tax=Drosophila eugracilis TaxID=29029 RepID=UPI0007E70EDB|nr:nucleosome assembly protein 1;1 [Drosophila eugracilis]